MVSALWKSLHQYAPGPQYWTSVKRNVSSATRWATYAPSALETGQLAAVDFEDMTLNGVTLKPHFAYYGEDAESCFWMPRGYGQVLDCYGVGAEPRFNQVVATLPGGGPTGPPVQWDSPFGESVAFQGTSGPPVTGKFMTSGKAQLGQLGFPTGNDTNQDFVLEMVFTTDGSELISILSKIGAREGNDGYGWDLLVGSSFSNIIFRIWHNGTLATGAGASVSSPSVDGYNHLMIFCNASEDSTEHGMMMYLNGVFAASGTSYDSVTGQNNMWNDGYMGVAFSHNPSASPFTSPLVISFLSMWKTSGWMQDGFAGRTEAAQVAAARYAALPIP